MIGRDGNAGFGEATILTGYTDETIENSGQAAKQFAADMADACIAARQIDNAGEQNGFLKARAPLMQAPSSFAVARCR